MRKTRNKNLNEDLAVKLYLDGYTQYKTAQILDTNYAHIRSVLLKKNISIRDKSFNRKQICDDFYFSQIDTHEKAYWLGFLAADGSVSKNKNEISIGLSAKDKSHIEIFKTITNSNSKIFEYTSTVKNKIYDCCKISIYSKQIKIDLKYHNIVPNKSKTLELSKNINPLFINSYLLGIIDGDGNFHLDKEGQMHFSLIGSKKEVEEIQSILVKKCDLNLNKLKQEKRSKKMWYLNYGGNKVVSRIVKYLYKNSLIYLQRKYDIINNLLTS